MAKPGRLDRRRAVLEQYKRGKITIRQGAEMLGLSYWAMNDLLRKNHIPLVGQAGPYEKALALRGKIELEVDLGHSRERRRR
ncbi:MAG: UPF0175 family protein [Acidobacteria bacterium]|nr:UPF0175 family protein [Acidobacteriota bacterium]